MAHTTSPLEDFIRSKGYSLNGFAEASGIAYTSLRRHLRDGDFKVTELRKAATTLDVSTALILSLAESGAVEHATSAA